MVELWEGSAGSLGATKSRVDSDVVGCEGRTTVLAGRAASSLAGNGEAKEHLADGDGEVADVTTWFREQEGAAR